MSSIKYSHSILITTLLSLFITACQSIVDKSIQLDGEFTSNAEVIKISPPNWRFRDSHFHASLGEFSAINVDISNERQTSKKLTGKRLEDDTLLNLALLQKFSFEMREVREYELIRNRHFSFDLVLDESVRTTAQCQSRYITLTEEASKRLTLGSRKKSKSGSSGYQNEIHEKWQMSFLECSLTQGQLDWELEVLRKNDNTYEVQLTSDIDTYQINPVSSLIVTLKDRHGNLTEREVPTKYTLALHKTQSQKADRVVYTSPFDAVDAAITTATRFLAGVLCNAGVHKEYWNRVPQTRPAIRRCIAFKH